MTDKEFAELLTKAEGKYGSEMTARFEIGFSTRNYLETYIELNEDDEDFEFSEEGFIEYLTGCVADYLYEASRYDLEDIHFITEKGEEV
jgi:hypothetical protein